MPQDEPSKILDNTAAAVCERAAPGDKARALLAEGMTSVGISMR